MDLFISIQSAFADLGPFALASAVLALALYVPATINIWRGTLKQSLATFVLWGILDGINAVSTFLADGNYLLPAAYTFGCTWVIVAIIKARIFAWSSFETICTGLVVVCMIAWALLGNEAAIVASTIAVIIAGLPQLRLTIEEPESAAPLLYLGFVAANGLGVLAGTDWSIEQRFYTGACLVYTFVVLAFAMRRWFPKAATAN